MALSSWNGLLTQENGDPVKKSTGINKLCFPKFCFFLCLPKEDFSSGSLTSEPGLLILPDSVLEGRLKTELKG